MVKEVEIVIFGSIDALRLNILDKSASRWLHGTQWHSSKSTFSLNFEILRLDFALRMNLRFYEIKKHDYENRLIEPDSIKVSIQVHTFKFRCAHRRCNGIFAERVTFISPCSLVRNDNHFFCVDLKNRCFFLESKNLLSLRNVGHFIRM